MVPSDYGKLVINTKNWDENKKATEEIEYKISGFEGKIKRMSEKEKKDKNVDETLEIIRKILAERVKLRQKLDIIATKERNINDELFSY